MKIVTWNMRFAWDGDGINSFIHRVGMVYDKVRKEQPTVIAFQEIVPDSLDVLQKLLPEYAFFGQMRSVNYDGEGLYTAVRKDSAAILGGETFWLSPTPWVAGSRFEKQSQHPRICVYTCIRNLANGEIYNIYNVHLDYEAEEPCVAGIRCVLEYMAMQNAKRDSVQVLLGDFNALPDSGAIRACEEYKGIFEATAGITETTFHNYGNCDNFKIDYVYLSDSVKERVLNVQRWIDSHEGIYLSDHYPICVELKEE